MNSKRLGSRIVTFRLDDIVCAAAALQRRFPRQSRSRDQFFSSFYSVGLLEVTRLPPGYRSSTFDPKTFHKAALKRQKMIWAELKYRRSWLWSRWVVPAASKWPKPVPRTVELEWWPAAWTSCSTRRVRSWRCREEVRVCSRPMAHWSKTMTTCWACPLGQSSSSHRGACRSLRTQAVSVRRRVNVWTLAMKRACPDIAMVVVHSQNAGGVASVHVLYVLHVETWLWINFDKQSSPLTTSLADLWAHHTHSGRHHWSRCYAESLYSTSGDMIGKLLYKYLEASCPVTFLWHRSWNCSKVHISVDKLSRSSSTCFLTAVRVAWLERPWL